MRHYLPLRYAGGKSRAAKIILGHIPPSVEHVVSPFFGGGAVEFALARERGVRIEGYDIFSMLVNYWRYQIACPGELADLLARPPFAPTSESYKAVKARLVKIWEGRAKESGIMKAALYWHNHNLSYGPGFLGWMSKIYADEARYARMLDRVRGFDSGRVSVGLQHFERVLPIVTKSFLYCDPPYVLGGDSKTFRGLYPSRNDPSFHEHFRHGLLADLLRKHRGGFVLSYNDCAWVREAYGGWCDIREVTWQYSMGQGETRIGSNRRGFGLARQAFARTPDNRLKAKPRPTFDGRGFLAERERDGG